MKIAYSVQLIKSFGNLPYLGVKMTSLDQKQNCHESCQYRYIKIAYLVERYKIFRKVACLDVSQLIS